MTKLKIDRTQELLGKLPGYGGTAFPVVTMTLTDGSTFASTGMTMRDWFAGQALVGLLTNRDVTTNLFQEGEKAGAVLAQSAYTVADAMLKDRGQA